MTDHVIAEIAHHIGLKIAYLGDTNTGADIVIKDYKVLDRILYNYSLGLGESYMENLWEETSQITLDKIFYLAAKSKLQTKLMNLSWRNKFTLLLKYIPRLWTNSTIDTSYLVGTVHYDKGNDFFAQLLDKRMIYSCAYFYQTDDLHIAQERKLDLIAHKLKLRPGMRVLDIGCGWGGLAQYWADKYKVVVEGVTISQEQFDYCEAHNQFPSLVKYYLTDYRQFPLGKYDAIVSVGMFEHVCTPNYKEFMQFVYDRLQDGGLFLLHTIGQNVSNCCGDAWLNKYIFPHSILPSLAQICWASERLFSIKDVHNLGDHYDTTLMKWYENFTKLVKNSSLQWSETDIRKWKYYLLSCAGLFRAQEIQLYQIVFAKGEHKDYIRVTYPV